MFIENLFRFDGVTVSEIPHGDHHYRIVVAKDAYPKVVARLQEIFYQHFEVISLLQRERRHGVVTLIIRWRKEVDQRHETYVAQRRGWEDIVRDIN